MRRCRADPSLSFVCIAAGCVIDLITKSRKGEELAATRCEPILTVWPAHHLRRDSEFHRERSLLRALPRQSVATFTHPPLTMVRAVLQRVAHARVVVEGRTVGEASRGILALVGVANGDTEEDIRWLHDKILDCRLFDSAEGKRWAGSVRSLKLDVMLVSQFTLHAVTRKSKPDFHNSMSGPAARGLFDALVASMRESHGGERVHTGEFGGMMEVSLLNDGPVTILLDSWNKAECGGHEPPAASTLDAVDTPTPSSTPTPTMAGAGGAEKGASTGAPAPKGRSQPSKKESSWKAYRATLDAAADSAAPGAPAHLPSDPAAMGAPRVVSETSVGAGADGAGDRTSTVT